ncbi:tyrosine-type recombinase/integrase [Qipengyuania oceanensis]|uniref:Integrase arm-type DNA-binding domain-containing protein n=1 Tax=Qipengyuania oceanensis TaxID=1463597 RepID=A0A844YHM7_9SPHN|nr:integrase arm-type DNA-binding domain-containing protein [Qipengyuania oceanensis]MXO63437.1 integrase arm-type DNA-binding domain-containing protein [Qipengyuania oceanensis]
MAKLTAKFVEKAKPGRYADGGGLYLLVKSASAKSWVLRVMADGPNGWARRDIGLGAVATESLARPSNIADDIPLEQRARLTLAEARELAVRLRNVAKAGGDPATERRKDRSPPPTFEKAAIAAHEALRGGWSSKTADAFLASLETHAFPSLGSRRVSDIDAGDIANALHPIWNAKPSIARKVRQRIGKVLDYAKAKNWRDTETPRMSVSTLVGKPKEGGNFAAMPWKEVPAYFEKLGGDAETVGRLALMFTIATACRSGEAREARWKHIKGDDWNRPTELQRKTGKAHTITLNAAALAVLDRAKAFSDSADPEAVIFPSRKRTELSDMALSKIMRDAGLPYVPHGFRSSFRDWAAERMPQIPDPVAEAALGHVVPDGVVKAYKRTTFIQMRRELLDAWGRFITGEESNVVRLDERRA